MYCTSALLLSLFFTEYITSLLTLLQRLIQTEADLMRLEEVHSALLHEHKNLQDDYSTLHGYVEVRKGYNNQKLSKGNVCSNGMLLFQLDYACNN